MRCSSVNGLEQRAGSVKLFSDAQGTELVADVSTNMSFLSVSSIHLCHYQLTHPQLLRGSYNLTPLLLTRHNILLDPPRLAGFSKLSPNIHRQLHVSQHTSIIPFLFLSPITKTRLETILSLLHIHVTVSRLTSHREYKTTVS